MRFSADTASCLSSSYVESSLLHMLWSKKDVATVAEGLTPSQTWKSMIEQWLLDQEKAEDKASSVEHRWVSKCKSKKEFM